VLAVSGLILRRRLSGAIAGSIRPRCHGILTGSDRCMMRELTFVFSTVVLLGDRVQRTCGRLACLRARLAALGLRTGLQEALRELLREPPVSHGTSR
jgi:hypothetical protein